MMAGFISWRHEYTKWLNAMADRDTKSFFLGGHQNKQMMRVTYRNLGDTKRFTEWLKMKADNEEMGTDEDGMFIAIGGS
jgi:hypothetical protein